MFLLDIILFLNMYLAFLIVADFPAFPYTSRKFFVPWKYSFDTILLHRQT